MWTKSLSDITETPVMLHHAVPDTLESKLKHHASDDLLEEVVVAFVQHGWEVKSQFKNTVTLQKGKLGMPNWVAILLLIGFSLIGLAIVARVKLVSMQKISLVVREDGKLRMFGKNVNRIVSHAREVHEVAQIPSGLGWGPTH